MRRRRWMFGRALVVLVALLAAVVVPLAAEPEPAAAVSGADFDPGNIITDANFYNGAAMTEAEIQQFLLNAVGGRCDNSNCLAVYRADTPTRTWSFGTCSTYVGGAAESAARIIFKVQQACNLSAKVILVTLQKEQSLVTDRAPSDSTMRKAMGYGCPDTSSCDSTYYGFFNQLFAAGRQLTWYGNPAGSFTSIRVGQVNPIRYHPNASCGSKDVLIKNRATAALYYYTPYTPNAAALANIGGLGDGCSAYGNRNFWVFYTNWFGSPSGGTNPFGNIEVVAAQPGAYRVGGWAIDPDTSAPIAVHVYVGGIGTAIVANVNRPDVGNAYPSAGPAHGFDAIIPATGSGVVSICLYAINSGPGANSLLGCRNVTAMSGAPVGALQSVESSEGAIVVNGWAIDPDTVGPVSVHLYVDSVGVAVSASAPTTAMGSGYAAYGNAHGFSTRLTAGAGVRQVCAFAINTGPGENVALGCKTVTVTAPSTSEQGRAPVGVLDDLAVSSTGLTASGWAIDPDTFAPIQVHLYLDGTGVAVAADQNRSGIPATWAAYGVQHGFKRDFTAGPGAHQVCGYAINTVGPATSLGCRTVNVPGPTTPDLGRAPFGNVEGIAGSADSVAVSGWAIDPDTSSPIAVHVYVDGVGVAVTADQLRPDVAAAYPGLGDRHGFAWSAPASPGSHTVCVYAINSGAGGHSLLRCGTVTVGTPTPPPATRYGPIGNLESVVRADGAIIASGWALDPDFTGSSDVHIYVDGVGIAVRASLSRPDVHAAYGLGADHGFSATVPASAGAHRVCAYAIDTAGAPATAIGCVSVP